MRSVCLAAGLVLAACAIACGGGPPPPVAIDPAHDACAECRMLISDVHFGAQIVAPGEEPRLFDDIGCLRAYLKGHASSREATAFVVDHLSGAWVPAGVSPSTSRATSRPRTSKSASCTRPACTRSKRTIDRPSGAGFGRGA